MAVAFEDNEMDLSRIPIGENPPHEVNVIIEIPKGGAPVKYEVTGDHGPKGRIWQKWTQTKKKS
jgi:hypothetical protein